MASLAPVPQASGAAVAESAAAAIGEPSEQKTAVEQMDAESSPASGARARDGDTSNGAEQSSAGEGTSAAAESAAVSVAAGSSAPRLPPSEFEERASLMFVLRSDSPGERCKRLRWCCALDVDLSASLSPDTLPSYVWPLSSPLA